MKWVKPAYRNLSASKFLQFAAPLLESLLLLGLSAPLIVWLLNLIVFKLALIESFNDDHHEFQHQLDYVTNFLMKHQMPKRILHQVEEYFNHVLRVNNGYDVNTVIDPLPDSIRFDISVHLFRSIIENVCIFRGALPGVISSVLMHLRPVVIIPDQVVMLEGEIGREMYFLRTGQMEVFAGDPPACVYRIHPGDYFGELALLLDVPRTITVKAVSFCEVYVLERAQLIETLRIFPDQAAVCMHEAERQKEILFRLDPDMNVSIPFSANTFDFGKINENQSLESKFLRMKQSNLLSDRMHVKNEKSFDRNDVPDLKVNQTDLIPIVQSAAEHLEFLSHATTPKLFRHTSNHDAMRSALKLALDSIPEDEDHDDTSSEAKLNLAHASHVDDVVAANKATGLTPKLQRLSHRESLEPLNTGNDASHRDRTPLMNAMRRISVIDTSPFNPKTVSTSELVLELANMRKHTRESQTSLSSRMSNVLSEDLTPEGPTNVLKSKFSIVKKPIFQDNLVDESEVQEYCVKESKIVENGFDEKSIYIKHVAFVCLFSIRIWNAVIATIVMYNFLLIPFRCAFFPEDTSIIAFIVLDYVGDLFLIIDLWIASKTSFYEKGIYIEDVNKLQKQYFFSFKFVLEFLSCFPFFDLLAIKYGMIPVLRIPRLLRGVIFTFFQRGEEKLKSGHHTSNILRLVFFIFLSSHFAACGYYTFTQYQGFYSQGDFQLESWHHLQATLLQKAGYEPSLYMRAPMIHEIVGSIKIPEYLKVQLAADEMILKRVGGNLILEHLHGDSVDDNRGNIRLQDSLRRDGWLPSVYYQTATVPEQYLRALIFGTTYLTGLGDIIHPNNFSQVVFCLCVMIFGKFFIAFLVGQVASIMAQSSANRIAFSTNMFQIGRYLKDLKVPEEVHTRFVVYVWLFQIQN